MRKRLVAIGAALLSCPEVVVASTLIVFLSALLVLVLPAQADKKASKGQAQAAARAEEAHSARDFGSVAEVEVDL